ncbi:MAG TPA: 50S ribosomal protein L23 [Verrucomicrobiae bacterium]|jgi:large subunit ribosomal protein L23|nr:50S ribosomal protein L23 [Verrucomicrobiae bacterium]
MNVFEIIKTVRLTEKGTRQSTQTVRPFERDKNGKPVLDDKGRPKIKERTLNQYTVVADRLASKPQIKQAVQELFKVKVTRVNTLNVRGKARRKRTAQAGQTSAWKKAIVTLKDGDKIILT